jgi:hypothetical protein
MIRDCSGCKAGHVYTLGGKTLQAILETYDNGKHRYGCSCTGNWQLVSKPIDVRKLNEILLRKQLRKRKLKVVELEAKPI